MTKRKVHPNVRNRRPRGNGSAQENNRSNNNGPRNNDNPKSIGGNGNRSGGRHNNSSQLFLPEPSVLQEYEYATEGAANKILQMAELEQERRNQWEDEYLQFHKKSMRIGQILGFFLTLAVVFSVVSLAENGHEQVAQVLAVSAFLSIALVSIFSSRSQNKYPRRPRKQ